MSKILVCNHLNADQLLDAFGDPGNKQEAIRLLSAFPDQSEIKNIKDNNSWYLIHWAARRGWNDVFELLATTYHCDPNCTNDWGWTSLHSACLNDQLHTVKLLTTQYCLDPLQTATIRTNSGGLTPLDFSGGETKAYLQQIIGKCVCLCVLFVYLYFTKVL